MAVNHSRVSFVAGLALLSSLGATATPKARAQVVKLDRNRFMPAEFRARPGDTLTFVNGPGGPHNVQFEKDSISPAAQKLLDAAFGKQRLLFLASTMLIIEGDTITLVVPDLPAGRYPLYCNPHFAQMRGALVVER